MIVGMLALAVVGAAPRAGLAASQADINASVEKGVAWLATQQHANGAFGEGGSGSHDVGDTGLAASALIDHARHLGLDPFSPAYAYSTQVVQALDFIFSRATRDAGQGHVSWSGSHGSYVWGPAIMAITASTQKTRVVNVSGSPVDGLTYLQVVREALAHIEAVQYSSGHGLGFWSYNPSYNFGDMSATGWVAMGLGYASYNFDITLSPTLLSRLSQGIDLAQWVGDVSDPRYGGVGYTSEGYTSWINLYKAGHLLYMLDLVGDASNSVRVQRVLHFINNHWNKPNSGESGYSSIVNGEYDMGWRGGTPSPLPSYIATTTMMKAFVLWGFDTIGQGIDWYDEMSDVIVTRQSAEGWWDQGGYPTYYRELSTVWALLTLLRAVPASGAISDITTTTATFTAETDASGTGYYVVVPRNASAPNAAQVKAGTDGAGAAAVTHGSGAVSGGVARAYGLTGLSSGTRYDLYFVNETAPDTFSNVVRVQFATLDLGSIVDVTSMLDLRIAKWALNYDTGALIATVRAEYLSDRGAALKPELHSTFWFAMADDANNKLELKDGTTPLGVPYTDVTKAFTAALQAGYGRATMTAGDVVSFTVGIFSRNRVPPSAAVYAFWADPPVHAADTNGDGTIDDFEILAAVDDWYGGRVSDGDFLTAVDLWRAGSAR